jgi:hypothetical protein
MLQAVVVVADHAEEDRAKKIVRDVVQTAADTPLLLYHILDDCCSMEMMKKKEKMQWEIRDRCSFHQFPAAGEALLPGNRNCFVVLLDLLRPSLLERRDIPNGNSHTGNVLAEVMRLIEGVP